MRINNNIMSMNAHRQLNINNNNGARSMEKLSSGMRINRAGDDAAGLSISEKMRGQIRGLKQASRNAQDGISMIQTAEGALNESHAILQRMRELVVQAGNGTNESEDLTAIQNELTALIEELGGETTSKGISDRTQFNGQDLLDGSLAGASGIDFQIGANSGQQVTLSIADMSASGLSVADVSVSGTFTAGNFDTEIGKIDSAIEKVSEERSKLGALQNRLEHTIANLDNASENLQAAESRIRDVDMAAEMMEFTKNNILSQAATAMMAQANMAPQSVLQLLG
ncbi:flagellin Hag [Alkalicella caledoniensis]|uniref:Flagellin n=1 Tax=Alkalicella caledoniensis TaxID=2731377 RepID=A0A7G9WD70_ALKCA|nr:flagellin Hag [Alkalicella caledoniensis]QNO16632.1 flagellin Hag [Alkalicella caledoniensis]